MHYFLVKIGLKCAEFAEKLANSAAFSAEMPLFPEVFLGLSKCVLVIARACLALAGGKK